MCDHRQWLQLLADEWWVPERDDSGFTLGMDLPYGVDCGDRIAVVALIDPHRLPDIVVPVIGDQGWRLGRLSETGRGDEGVYWNAPIPLVAMTSFSVATEAQRSRLASMSRGFANLVEFDQPLTVRPVVPRANVEAVPNVQSLRPPAAWNALRGAAAMALWSLPSTAPWLDLVCSAFSRQRPSRNDPFPVWWGEPPWLARPAERADTRDLALWRAILDTFAMHRLRDGWNRQDLLDEVIGRAILEFGDADAFDVLKRETMLLLRDQKTVDVADGGRDPLGLALQLVLLRPTADRFETWKTDLPGMQPAVWLTAATLAGLVTGYRDLEPRFTGLPAGRFWSALRIWEMYSVVQAPQSWPGMTDTDPRWSADADMLCVSAGGTVLARRRQNGRGRWHLSDLSDPHVRKAAIALARSLQPSLVRPVMRITTGSLSWLGTGTIRAAHRQLIVEGEVVLPLSDMLVIDCDIDESQFKDWIAHAAIDTRLPAPPAPAAGQRSLPEAMPRQGSLLDEGNGIGIPASTDVPGLIAVPSFISEEEERQLVAAVDGAAWSDDLSRRVQHYGWRYDYKARKVNPAGYIGPLPDWARPLAERLVAAGLTDEMPDQVIVNEYIGKQGIAAHVDCESCFRGAVVTISLLESWEMVFCHRETKNKASVLLERGSAIVMQGAARHDWTHEIRRRLKEKWGKRGRRISLTFRKVSAPEKPVTR